MSIFLLSFLATSVIHAQVEEIKEEGLVEKNSFSINVLGTASYVGFSYERILYQRINLEIGIGLIGYGAGLTMYPIKKIRIEKLNPFFGIKYSNHAIVDGENKSVTYVPFGVTYCGINRLNISIDAGPAYIFHKSPGYRPTREEKAKYPFSDYGVFGNLKLSYRF